MVATLPILSGLCPLTSNAVIPMTGPSGIHLKLAEGADALSTLRANYDGLRSLMQNDPVIREQRLVINLQEWKEPPRHIDRLLDGLQRFAEGNDLTIELKWRGTDGPKAWECEPASVREAQDGLVAMAAESAENSDPYRDKLLEELLKNPDDREVLHVYADYLLSKGDPQGDLIALALGPQTPEAINRAMMIRFDFIHRLNEENGVWISQYEFKNGLLEEVRISQSEGDGLRALLSSPVGRTTRTLYIGGRDSFSVPDLVGALPGSQVSKLVLSEVPLGPVDVRALAGVLPETQVKSLTFRLNGIDDECVEILVEALSASRVTALAIHHSRVGASGARSLARILPRSSLEVLDLSGNAIGDEGARVLARSLLHSELKELYLMGCRIHDDGAWEFAWTIGASQLTTLTLDMNIISEECHIELNKRLLQSQDL